jgi:hypothetical protein
MSPDRQNELEPRPILAVRQRRKFAAVTLDYHAANGQSQSHSIWLCRDEWIKYAVQSCWIDSRSGIFHCDDNCIGTLTLRYHPKHPISIHRVIHRFDRTVDQVEDDLSQLTPMAVDTRQVGRKLGFGRNAVVRQLFTGVASAQSRHHQVPAHGTGVTSDRSGTNVPEADTAGERSSSNVQDAVGRAGYFAPHEVPENGGAASIVQPGSDPNWR